MAMALVSDLHPPSWLAHPVAFMRHENAPDRRDRIGQWALDVKRDSFTGTVSCSLKAPRMSFDRAAVTFQFSPRTETFDAVYRVDAGPALSWRISAMALAAHGVRLQNDDALNPSGGRVILPYSAVVGAKTVWIRPGPKARPRPFTIEGLSTAVAAARQAGCGADFTGALAE